MFLPNCYGSFEKKNLEVRQFHLEFKQSIYARLLKKTVDSNFQATYATISQRNVILYPINNIITL